MLKRLCHPIRLMKSISRKIGLTRVIKGVLSRLKRLYHKAREELKVIKYGRSRPCEKYALKKIINLPLIKEIAERKKLGKIKEDIKFSILVPLYNTPMNFLNEMIGSVELQTYDGWELCLADGSDEKHQKVGKACKKYARKDARIKYYKLEKNYGISGNTNECIRMASGDFIALFDHDDFLHPRALTECLKEIQKYGADYVYTDEATFEGELDNIITYHFKPDYAPDNLRANNYICHFSVFSRALLDKAGWYNPEYDGSQDHDIILRLTENAKCIRHIQEVLYYWRSHPGSVAEDINSKFYAIEAGKKAVLAHIKRMGWNAVIESSKAFPTIYRIKYDIVERPLISIIIPNRNHVEDLKRCISSVMEYSSYDNYEILIVENGSDDEKLFDYYKSLGECGNVRIITWDKPFNYSAVNNYAVRHANGGYVLFLNNDVEIITHEWIEEMLMYAQREDVGAVGAKLYYPDDTIQHAGIILGMGAHHAAGHGHYRCDKSNLGYMGRLYYAQNVSAVTGACLLVRKKLFLSVGGFDEQLVLAYNDVDFCMKLLKAGYLNVFTPYAELYHYESLTRGLEDTPEKAERFNREVEIFRKRWHSAIESGDPYYNRNLALDRSDFALRK